MELSSLTDAELDAMIASAEARENAPAPESAPAPVQKVDLSKLSDEELDAMIARANGKLAAANNPTPVAPARPVAPRYDPQNIGKVTTLVTADEAKQMPKMGGAELASLQTQAEGGPIAETADGSVSNWLGNFWNAVAYNSSGKLTAKNTAMNNQDILRGTVRKDGKEIPLTQLDDSELDYLVDAAGWNGPGAYFRRFLGKWARSDEGIMQDWDRSQGAKIADPVARKQARVRYAQDIARMNVKQQESEKLAAQTEIDNRQRQTGAGIVSGGITQGAYMLPYMIPGAHGVVAGAIEGADRAQELLSDRYEVEPNGNIRVAAERDSTGKAIAKGAARGVIAPLIEFAGGELATGALKGIASGTLGRIPLVKNMGGKFVETAVGKAVNGYIRSMSRFGKMTGLQSFPVEAIEELEDQVVDSALGLNTRSSETEGNVFTRAGESAKQFLKPESLMDLAESMLLVQVFGGGIAALNDRTRSKAIDNILARDLGVEKDALKGYSADEKWAAYEEYTKRMPPEEVEKKFDAGRRAIDELTKVMGESDAALADFEQLAGGTRSGGVVSDKLAQANISSAAEGRMSVANAAEGERRAGGMLSPEEAFVQQKVANDEAERQRAAQNGYNRRLDDIVQGSAETEVEQPSSVRGGLDNTEAVQQAADAAVENNRAEYDKWLSDAKLPDTPQARMDWFNRTSPVLKEAQERVQTVPQEGQTEAAEVADEAGSPSDVKLVDIQESRSFALRLANGANDGAVIELPDGKKYRVQKVKKDGATITDVELIDSDVKESRDSADATAANPAENAPQSVPSAEGVTSSPAEAEGAQKAPDATDATQTAKPVDTAAEKPYTTNERTTENGQPQPAGDTADAGKSAGDAGAESGVAPQDEFQRLLDGSRQMADDERRAYQSGSKALDESDLGSPVGGRSENRKGRVVDALRGRIASGNGGSGLDSVTETKIPFSDKHGEETFKIGQTDARTFHDVFEYVRNHLKNGELVDLHDVKDYEDADCYLSEDGLSGFAVTPDGNLISVFSLRRGSLGAMKDAIIAAGANHLDAFASDNQNLRVIYDRTLGFKPVADMEFNPDYDQSGIGEKHGNPDVTFMALPKKGQEFETKRFGKDDYDAAVAHLNAEMKKPPKLVNPSAEAKSAEVQPPKLVKPEAVEPGKFDAKKQREYEDWLFDKALDAAIENNVPETEEVKPLPDTPENREAFAKSLEKKAKEDKKLSNALANQRETLTKKGEDKKFIDWLEQRGIVIKAQEATGEHPAFSWSEQLEFARNQYKAAMGVPHKPSQATVEQPPKLRRAKVDAQPEETDVEEPSLDELPSHRSEQRVTALREEGKQTTVTPEEAKDLDGSIDGVVDLAAKVFHVDRAEDEGDIKYRQQIAEAVSRLSPEERLQYAKLLAAQNGLGMSAQADPAERRLGWEEDHGMLLGRINTQREAPVVPAHPKPVAEEPQPPKLRTAAEAEAANGASGVAKNKTGAKPAAKTIASGKVMRISPDPVKNDALAKFMPEASRGNATFREEPMMGGSAVFMDGKNTGVFIGDDGKFFVPNTSGKFESFDKAQAFLQRKAANVRRGDTIEYVDDDGKIYRGKADVRPNGTMAIRVQGEVVDGKTVATQTRNIEIPNDRRTNVTVKSRNMFSLASETVPESWDDTVKAGVQKAAEHVKGWLKGVKVKFAEEPVESGAESRDLHDDKGNVVGSYDRETNEVVLYPGATADTVAHEIGAHATYKFAQDEAKAGRDKLLKMINANVDAAPKAIVDAIKKAYGNLEADALRDEIWAHMFEQKHGAELDKALRTMEGRAWYNRMWDAIKRAAGQMLKAFGVDVNRVDLAKLERMKPEDGMAWLAKQFAKGKTLGSVEGEGEGAGIRNSLMPDTMKAIRDAINGYAAAGFKMSNLTGTVISMLNRGGKFTKMLPGFEQTPLVINSPVAKTDGAPHRLDLDHSAFNHNWEAGHAYTGYYTWPEFDRAFLDNYFRRAHKIPDRNNTGHEVWEWEVNYPKNDAHDAYKLTWRLVRNSKTGDLLNLFTTREQNDYPPEQFVEPKKTNEASEGEHFGNITPEGVADPSSPDASEESLSNSAAEGQGWMSGSSIRESRRIVLPEGAKPMDEKKGRGTKLRETWQDSNIDIRNVQDEIGKVEDKVDERGHTDAKTEFERDASGNVIYEDIIRLDEDGNKMYYKNGKPVVIGKRPKRIISIGSTNVYEAKDRANGYVQAGINDLQKRRDNLSKVLADNDISPKMLDKFLVAMHAEERNRTTSERDGRAYDPNSKFGSGMSEVEANEFLSSPAVADKRAAYEAAAKIVWDMNKADLKRRLDSGRIKQEQYDLLGDQWKHYVPLRTDAENTALNAFNMSTAGFRANEFAMAKGRETEAASPTAFSFLRAQQGVNGAERNIVYQTLANLVRHAEKQKKPIGKIVEGQAQSQGAGWTFDFGDGERVVADGASKLAANHDNIILFKEDGVLKAIRIDPGAEGRGVDFAKAVRGDNIGKWGDGLQWIPRMTRFMSEMRTQYSPTFSVRNALADHLESQQAFVGRYGLRDGIALAKSAIKAEAREFKNLVAYVRRGTLEGRVKEFVEGGGLIKGGVASMGFAGEANEIRDTYVKFVRKTKGFAGMTNSERAKALWDGTFDMIKSANEVIENSTRIGIFSALRDRGVPIQEAIKFAREATVNFNRKGTAMPWFNGLYMFANAAMQGTTRAGQAFIDDWKGEIPSSGLGSKRKFRGELTTTLIALGVAKAVLDHFVGDDDDREEAGGRNARNLSEYDKKHLLGVPVGGGNQLVLLRTRGPYAAIPYIAQTLANVALGETDWQDAAKNIASEVGSQAVDIAGGNGIGSKSEALQTLMPSVGDPFVQWATGTDYKGEDRVKRSLDRNQPASHNGRDQTSAIFKAAAESINFLTGGNENRKGVLDWAPEDIQLAWDTILGGVGRDISNIIEGGENAYRRIVKGEKPEKTVSAYPFLKDVIREYPENTRRFYDAYSAYEADKAEFRKTTDMKRRAELKREHPYLSQGKGRIDNLKGQIDDLRHWEKNEVKNGNKWVTRKQPITDARRNEFRARRLRLQATILKILGE